MATISSSRPFSSRQQMLGPDTDPGWSAMAIPEDAQKLSNMALTATARSPPSFSVTYMISSIMEPSMPSPV